MEHLGSILGSHLPNPPRHDAVVSCFPRAQMLEMQQRQLQLLESMAKTKARIPRPKMGDTMGFSSKSSVLVGFSIINI